MTTTPTLPAAKPGTPLARVNTAIERALTVPPTYEGASHLDRLTHHLAAWPRPARRARPATSPTPPPPGSATSPRRRRATGQVLAAQARAAARMLLPSWAHPIDPAAVHSHFALDLTTDVACVIASGHTYLETDDRLLEQVIQHALAAAALLDTPGVKE